MPGVKEVNKLAYVQFIGMCDRLCSVLAMERERRFLKLV